jgi:Phytanoyl-CoA dioxygenase (PhyH)
MLTDAERFLFDLNGYIVVKNALPNDLIVKLRTLLQPLVDGPSLIDIDFLWHEELLALADMEPVFAKLGELVGPSIRIDHAFAATEKYTYNCERMHHSPFLERSGLFYGYSRGQFFNGLVGVIYCLNELKDQGGFCCIPGSHKSLVGMPDELYAVAGNEHVRNVQQQPGDAIIFSEALTHGTYPPGDTFDRLSVFIKYAPGWMAFRQPLVACDIGRLSPTPGYGHGDRPALVAAETLSDRQRILLGSSVYSRDRPETSQL